MRAKLCGASVVFIEMDFLDAVASATAADEGAQSALARLLLLDSGESFSSPLSYLKGTAALGVAPIVVHRNDGLQMLAEAAVDCALALMATGSRSATQRAFHFKRGKATFDEDSALC